MELHASGVQVSEDIHQDLEAVLQRYGGKVELFGHPTTTLEALFVRIVEESKAHPGRRYLPSAEAPAGDGATAATTGITDRLGHNVGAGARGSAETGQAPESMVNP